MSASPKSPKARGKRRSSSKKDTSAVNLVVQAIDNADEDTLEFILDNTQNIETSVRQIPESHAPKLLELLINRVLYYADPNGTAIKWMKEIFRQHGIYLVEKARSLEFLGEIVASLRPKISWLQTITKIKGKLEALESSSSDPQPKKKFRTKLEESEESEPESIGDYQAFSSADEQSPNASDQEGALEALSDEIDEA